MSAALEVTPRKQLSILIIQLGEIEEIFQSLMAIKAVKRLYPEMKIHVIVRSGKSVPVQRVDWIESVLEIPKIGEKDGLKVVAAWVNGIIETPYDLLCNWTYSAPHLRFSSILTTLIPSAVKYGNHLSDDGTIVSLDAWSIYREAWLRDSGIDQDIHPTDIITTQLLTALQIHAGEPLSGNGTASVTSRNFFKTDLKIPFPETVKKWVAVHPDSLDPRFEEVIDMILRRHSDWGVVLLNDSPWTPENQAFSGHPRILNLCGTLEFESLVDALSKCSWLFAGRAPIVELSSLLALRSLYWIESHPKITEESKGKWTESGPYGNGNIAVRFSGDFSPETFYAIWSHFQSEWYHQGKITIQKHFENLGLSSLLKETELYRSRIRPSEEGGGVSYDSLLEEETSFELLMFRLRGQLARSWFCGWIPPIDHEVSRMKLNSELIGKLRAFREPLKTLGQISAQGKTTALELAKVSSKVKNRRIMAAEERQTLDLEASKIREIETLLARVAAVEPGLRAFQSWYLQMMNHLQGKTIEEMAQENAHTFELLADGVELMDAYVSKVLDKAKPKSVPLSEQVTTLKEK